MLKYALLEANTSKANTGTIHVKLRLGVAAKSALQGSDAGRAEALWRPCKAMAMLVRIPTSID